MIVNSLGNYVDAVVLDDRQRALRPIDLVGFQSLIPPINRRYTYRRENQLLCTKRGIFRTNRVGESITFDLHSSRDVTPRLEHRCCNNK